MRKSSSFSIQLKVNENITYNKTDEDLPTIVDGHENQVIIDRVPSN